MNDKELQLIDEISEKLKKEKTTFEDAFKEVERLLIVASQSIDEARQSLN